MPGPARSTPHPRPAHKLSAALPGLNNTQARITCSLSWSYDPPREVPKFPHQVYSQTQISHMPMGAGLLPIMVCPLCLGLCVNWMLCPTLCSWACPQVLQPGPARHVPNPSTHECRGQGEFTWSCLTQPILLHIKHFHIKSAQEIIFCSRHLLLHYK